MQYLASGTRAGTAVRSRDGSLGSDAMHKKARYNYTFTCGMEATGRVHTKAVFLSWCSNHACGHVCGGASYIQLSSEKTKPVQVTIWQVMGYM